VEALEFARLEGDGLAHGSETLDLGNHLFRQVVQSLGDFQAEARELLYGALHRQACDGLPDFLFARAGRLVAALGLALFFWVSTSWAICENSFSISALERRVGRVVILGISGNLLERLAGRLEANPSRVYIARSFLEDGAT